MNFFERYSKEIIEPFAIKTIGLSYSKEYLNYVAPNDTNNFDYISPSGDNALEITLVTSENEMNAYVYEKLKAQDKQDLKTSHIEWAKLKDDGKLLFYRGGSMGEIKREIYKALNKKQDKALKRLKDKTYNSVDLCICMVDGSLFDQYSFELAFDNLDEYIFTNIFFITPSYFICYNKNSGFKEYPRIIQ